MVYTNLVLGKWDFGGEHLMGLSQNITLLWWLSSGYRQKLASTTASIVVGAFITTGLLTLSATVHNTLLQELGTPKSQYFLKQKQLNMDMPSF